ncbi:hypothetical protein [Desulfobacterium sp. N47]|uniref:Lipoprotein n=1 Tax=uncultured Desulfobacterium sp. TaxID=201089 RepID=E1YA89_9BACT|nr:unknown protein [uncultured Desulfobacterium sp.]
MLKQIFIAVIVGVALLSGCGEPYQTEGGLYIDAAQTALIAKGICSNPTDCQSKELLFWNDGEYFLDILPKDVTFVNLYNIRDPVVVEAVVLELKKVQESISKPGVVLNVYKSKHLEPVVKLQRVVIK